MLKSKYEGAGGTFASESSRMMVPASSISDVLIGEKRKSPEEGFGNGRKAPLGMWDAFGDDIAKFGYSDTKDVFLDSTSGVIPKP